MDPHRDELDRPYKISQAHVQRYAEQGFIRIKDVLSSELLAHYHTEITRLVRASKSKHTGATGTYQRAFTQCMNLWRKDEQIARLVKSRKLAQMAADLMGVEGVRLYHDQALYKEPWGGHTPWHVDQFYWPLSSDNTITLWIPLQAVSPDMGPLSFAPGSHRDIKDIASQLAISDESEALIAEQMSTCEIVEKPFEVGEVSFHSGWTCHRAGPNNTDTLRAAFTVIYMDKDMRMIEPQHASHELDAKVWLPGVAPGEMAASPLNPLL
jgi:ectoine hydroxylase-related dioxygenase (phytanoyl-CoA dioxygenase family)